MRSTMSRPTRCVLGRWAVAALSTLTLTFAAAAAEAGRETVFRGTRAEVPVPKNLSFELLKETTTDPQGDTLGGAGVQIDIRDFSVDAVGGNLVIGLTFYGDISAPGSGEANALEGFIDLDTDQVASPDDAVPWTDFLLDQNTTGMGNEYHVDLFNYDAVEGTVEVVDEETAFTAGLVPMTLTSNSLTITIPLSVLGDDDGAVNAAAVVFPELADPTDKVPNLGNLSSVPATGNPDTVFLQGNRFTVDVVWTDPDGLSGTGKLITQSDDSAVLYFFSENNWEMLIKVLDGCEINGFYWVFFAATTDVQFELTVTDTQANETRVFENPQNQPADAVTETDTFATCP